jgi:hypothetical protein
LELQNTIPWNLGIGRSDWHCGSSEVSSTNLRGGGGEGSISFLVHFAAIPLFGGVWAAIIAGGSALTAQVVGGRPLNRTVFNSSQKFLVALLAAATYQAVGGAIPPTLLQPGVASTFADASRDLVAFLVAVWSSLAQIRSWSAAPSQLAPGRAFGAVWKTNTLVGAWVRRCGKFSRNVSGVVVSDV